MGRYTFTGLNEYVHAYRPNYNGRSLDKSLDISTHCSSMCRADLTKWPDENASVVLAIVKRDTEKSQANTQTLSWLRCELERDKCHVASLHRAVCKKYERSLELLKNFSKV